MIHALKPFAESEVDRRIKLNFVVERRPSHLDFSFVMMGSVPADLKRVIRAPVSGTAERQRRDELWNSTCFEVFFGPADTRNYFEMNLGPSGDWNIYAFDDYRAGMRAVVDAHPPLESHDEAASGDHLVWTGRIHAGSGELKDAFTRPSLVLGATAVIEYEDGMREYWALSHAGAKPDFHLRESFRLVL